MRRFVLGWKTLGHEQRFQAKIVNYADDFVICCRGRAKEAMHAMREMMRKLKLTVNEEKTHLCRLPEETFDFLGYTFGRCYSREGYRYIGQRPSKQKVQSLCRRISQWTSIRWHWLEAEEQVGRLNRVIQGWANYFSQGPVNAPYRKVNLHARNRLRHWLLAKHDQKGLGYTIYSDDHLHEVLGLTRLHVRPELFRVRTHESLSESRMRENRTSGLMRGRRGNGAR